MGHHPDHMFLPPACSSMEETERAVSNHHNFINDPMHSRVLLILPLSQGIHQIGKPSPLPLQKQRHRGRTDNCTLHPGQLTQSKSVQEGLFSTHNNSTECPAGPYLHQWTWLDQMRDQSPPKSFQCKRACKQYSKSNQAFSSIPCHFI